MNQLRYYHLKSKLFTKKNFRALFMLYMACNGIYITLYTSALMGSEHIFVNTSAQTLDICVRAVCILTAFIAVYRFIENFKNKYRPHTHAPIIQILIIGGLYGGCELFDLISLPGNWTIFISFAKVLGQMLAVMFIMYSMLSQDGSVGSIMKNAKNLFNKKILDYLKTVVSFIPIWLAGQIITQLPTLALENFSFYQNYSIVQQIAAMQVMSFICALIAVFPVYAQAKLYIGLWVMFEDDIE